ncbi:MAG: cell division protein ZapA [Eubacteriales bacterium]|jgi:cell division protein ZapA|nr:cell division protein ZapA [Eubacteriales bacterium]HBS92978.1 cell division protein ZapA [Bacillota bacterium]MDD3073635.1 cell division protein ZapA [Eubacteriales bacterium]MDD4079579.1 cell division protein ZapA [Eubacteriales bacterium]MDD4769745.1 cell division protein ZapA [Eubacteriales bacterium]
MGDYHRITVEIGGQTLMLRTQNDPEYIKTLAKFVDGKIQSLAKNNPRLSISQLALLTAINLADEIHSADSQAHPRGAKKR